MSDETQTQEDTPAGSPSGDGPRVEAHGPPEPDNSAAQKNLERPSAEEIYQQVARNAREELKRRSISLAVSGFTGGTFMGLTALGVGILVAMLGNGPHAFLISRMLYPLGFIVVMIGRSQLFTENTLYPVALILAEKKEIWNTARLWAIVLPTNLLGALGFACLIALTRAAPPNVVAAISQLGVEGLQHPLWTVFWSAVVGGWMIATAAWMLSGSHSVTGSIGLIWLITYVVGAGRFAHCIASSAEILTSVLTGAVPWTAYARWLGPAVAGNVCGGVLMVTLLEYGQAIYGRDIEAEARAREESPDSAMKGAAKR